MPYQPFDASRYADSIGRLLLSRGDIEAQRAQQVANAQMQAQQARGQAWGGAVSNIGQTIAGSVGQYLQEKRDAPIRAQQLEAGRQQNELGRMQIASARQGAEDKSILGSAQGSGLEPAAVKAQLQQLGRGDLIPIYEQTHANLETARLGLQEQRTKVQGLESDYFGALASGVKKAKYDPVAVEWALTQADADGHDTKQLRAMLKQKPDALPQLIDGLIEKSPTQRKLMGEEADRALSQTREDRALSASQQLQADREADNTRADAAAMALQRDREADNRRADATAAAGRSNDTEWVTRDGEAVQIPKGTAQRGDVPYRPESGGGLGAANIQTRNARAAAALNGIEKLITLAPKRTPGPLGIAEGAIEVGKGVIGYSTKVRQYQALIQPVAMQMAVAIQGAANLSNTEREAMAKMLGSIGSMDYESQMALLENAKDLIKSGHDVAQAGGAWVPANGRIKVAPRAPEPGAGQPTAAELIKKYGG